MTNTASASKLLCLFVSLALLASAFAGSDRAAWKCTKENNLKCQEDGSHCKTSEENCNGCIDHIGSHMTEDGDRTCNTKRLNACKQAKWAARIQYNNFKIRAGGALSRAIVRQKLNGGPISVWESSDCVDYANECLLNNGACEMCRTVCNNVADTLDHIGQSQPLRDEMRDNALNCVELEEVVEEAIDLVPDTVNVMSFTGLSLHCGLN